MMKAINEPHYLCYDIRGIQRYIFRIPRLRYIIGGSALVDRFDRQFVPSLQQAGIEHVMSAGGKGCLRCDNMASRTSCVNLILKEAHRLGLDIRLGADADFSEAANGASDLFPFVPDLSDTQPCTASGLYPAPPGKTTHPVVDRRVFDRGDDMRRYFENRLLTNLALPGKLSGRDVAFFQVVTADVGEVDIQAEARRGAAALGNRNRWAVIAMDGNDIGRQFRTRFASGSDPGTDLDWIRNISGALDACSFAAAQAGIQAVLSRWLSDRDGNLDDVTLKDGTVILPIRPLVVGGDDLAVLCHPGLAMTFVEAATASFAERSRTEESNARKANQSWWHATDGELTISSGVLYCSVSMPLHSAMEYAESLLASAKGGGRLVATESGPTPAFVDWETVTESMLDTPAARRHRELRFADDDLNGTVIELTCRPYSLADLSQLLADANDALSNIPNSLMHSLMPGLRAGSMDRDVFIARIGKNYGTLKRMLAGPRTAADAIPPGSRWQARDGNPRTLAIDLLDAVSLKQEESRLIEETV